MPELPDGLRYRAFLSYRSADRKLASWLHRKLETYRVPRRLGKSDPQRRISARIGPIFRDRDDAKSAHDIETTISEHLARSEHLIVLCTPSAAAQESWVPREIEIFRRERPSGDIHAVIGDGEPPACFPKPLLTLAQDGSVRAPLAADLRNPSKGGDGRAKAVIKLLAAILGVEFDDLWRRERRRRNARIMLLTGVVLVLLVGVGVSLQQRENLRLASIFRAFNDVDQRNNGELADLLLIAAGPPPNGGIVTPAPQQVEALRSIARRTGHSFAGAVAQLQQDSRPAVVSTSHDGRLIFSMSWAGGSVFVWDANQNRLVARLPMRATDWLSVTPDPIRPERFDPLALAVSDDARFVTAVYAATDGGRRDVARWKLSAGGSCDFNCLPETFSFELPTGERNQEQRSLFGIRAKLFVESTMEKATYVEAGSQPVEIDFSGNVARAFTPLSADEQTRCNLSVPEAPPSRTATGGRAPGDTRKDISAPPPPPPPSIFLDRTDGGEAIWSFQGGRTLARLPYAKRTIYFYAGAQRREVARLKLPEETSCIAECDAALVFVQAGQQALITNTSNGRIYGMLDLDQCRFDGWPSLWPESLLSEATEAGPTSSVESS